MIDIKRCEDCRWFKRPWILPIRLGRCVSPLNFQDPVSRTIPKYEFAGVVRMVAGGCGPQALWFEQKK
jgi:hypothetical protein